ncbi:MAG: ABC transporter transmembrane domain-containing protein [Chloroflexi bacterium]|nr:ABC transporter transmembrane domain-containing protein [Chloroflexota bacterium]
MSLSDDADRPAWRQTLREFAWWHDLGVVWTGRPAEPLRTSSLWRLFGRFLPYWPAVAGVLLLIVVSAAVGTIPPLITRSIIDQALPAHNQRLLLQLILATLGVYLLTTAIGLLHTLFGAVAANGVVRDVRAELEADIRSLPPEYRRQQETDTLTARVINDVGVVGGNSTVFTGIAGIFDTVLGAVNSVAVLGASLVAMFLLNWRFALAVVLILPPFVTFGVLTARWVYAVTRRMYEKISDVNYDFQQLGTGRPVPALAFHRDNALLANLGIMLRFLTRSFSNLWSVGPALATALLWWLGGSRIMQGRLELGTLIAFLAYVSRVEKPVQSLLNVLINVRGIVALSDRIYAAIEAAQACSAAAGDPATVRQGETERSRESVFDLLHLSRWLRRLDLPLQQTAERDRVGGLASLARLLRFFLPYWPYWLLVVLMAVIAIGGLGQIVPLFQRMIIDQAIPQQNRSLLLLGVLGILAYPVIHIITGTISTVSHEIMSNRALQNFRDAFYDSMNDKPTAFFAHHAPSEITSRGVNDVNGVYSGSAQLANLTWQEIPVVSAVIIMFALNWRLGLVVLLLMPPFILWTAFMGRVTYALKQRIFERVRQLHTLVSATAAGTVQDGERQASEGDFAALNQELANYGVASNLLAWLFQAVFGGKAVIVRGIIWWFGGAMVMGGALSLGTLLAIMTYSDRLEGLGELFNGYVTVKGVQANVDRVFELMDDRPLGQSAPVLAFHTESGR